MAGLQFAVCLLVTLCCFQVLQGGRTYPPHFREFGGYRNWPEQSNLWCDINRDGIRIKILMEGYTSLPRACIDACNDYYDNCVAISWRTGSSFCALYSKVCRPNRQTNGTNFIYKAPPDLDGKRRFSGGCLKRAYETLYKKTLHTCNDACNSDRSCKAFTYSTVTNNCYKYRFCTDVGNGPTKIGAFTYYKINQGIEF